MKSAAGGPLATDVEQLTNGLNLSRLVSLPTFIAVSGLPGTGKSYFSPGLAERWQFMILESDITRKSLFSPPSFSAEKKSGLIPKYSR
jgi:hypothetical protein